MTGAGLALDVRHKPLELCRNKAGYETEPLAPMRVDLDDLERRAAAGGMEALVNAGVILVLKAGAVEFSVFDSGKLLFKTQRVEEAEAAMRTLYGAMGWA